MAHEHQDHSHYHIQANERSTKIVVLLSVLTMALELYFGYANHSVALTMDGWHMLTHVLVMSLAWAAYWYLKTKHKEGNQKLKDRVISLSAFASAIVLLVVTLLMTVESIKKFFHLDIDASDGALVVSVVGLIINGISAYVLHREEAHQDLNMHAAYLHVVSDIVISIFAIISLFAARFFDLKILDPICGLLSALIIIRWAVGLIRKSWGQIVLK
jgi:cation diffusion facilitator family transporter